MSIQVTWPRTSRVSAEERLLRDVFEYVGIDPNKADNATLITMVEQYHAALEVEE